MHRALFPVRSFGGGGAIIYSYSFYNCAYRSSFEHVNPKSADTQGTAVKQMNVMVSITS